MLLTLMETNFLICIPLWETIISVVTTYTQVEVAFIFMQTSERFTYSPFVAYFKSLHLYHLDWKLVIFFKLKTKILFKIAMLLGLIILVEQLIKKLLILIALNTFHFKYCWIFITNYWKIILFLRLEFYNVNFLNFVFFNFYIQNVKYVKIHHFQCLFLSLISSHFSRL